jgi:uncharacterized protein (TIGR04141 family)
MSERINAKLYKIQDSLLESTTSFDELIQEMVAEYRAKSEYDYREVKLLDTVEEEGFISRLFILNTIQRVPQWFEFLKRLVINPEDLSNLETKYSSFILFIYNVESMFVVTKGYHGHHLLANYIDLFFGLDVLARLVKKSETEIRSIEERAVFGIELAALRFFRSNYNLSYEDDFGKIYKTMLAMVDEKDFERLGIIKKKDDTNKVCVYGSTSFEVSTNFDYQELIGRLLKIIELFKSKGVQFNQFYRLSIPELSKIRDSLNEKLFETAYDAYRSKETMDFYHPEVIDYLRSVSVKFDVLGDSMEIPFAPSLTFLDIINTLVKADKIDVSSKDTFIKGLKESKGAFITNDNDPFTNYESLIKWLGGEVTVNSKKYFKIDNVWYSFQKGFDKYLNDHLGAINFDTSSYSCKLLPWDKKIHSTEGDYNLSYANSDGFIVTDTAFVNKIELCDLIQFSNNNIYLYHVKSGLGRDFRVLANQIINAARSLKFALSEGDSSYFEKYYHEVSNKNYNKKEITILTDGKKSTITSKSFVEMFMSTRKIILVFAYSSKSKKTIQDEIISTNSRIAKLSLLYCIRDIKRIDFELLIYRIPEIK